MTNLTISSKGWVVIPAELRKKYNLHPGKEMRIVDYGGVLAIVPSLADPVKQAAGILKGPKSMTEALLREHQAEAEHG